MVSPQKERGYVGIANDIWDEIIRRNFTKRQKDILLFILRMSYGCNRKAALIPKQKDFAMCGVGANHIKSELNYLIQCRVIQLGSQKGEYLFNKNYDAWQVSPVFDWDESRYKELIHINLQESKYSTELPESGSSNEGESGLKTSQNGNFSEGEKLPEMGTFGAESGLEKVPEMGSLNVEKLPKTGTFGDEKLPEMGTFENAATGKLPEMGSSQSSQIEILPEMGSSSSSSENEKVPETGSSTVDEPNQGAASGASKKGLKDLKAFKDLKALKDLKDNVVHEVISYLNEKTKKNFSPMTKSTIKSINGRLAEGHSLKDFFYVIDVKAAEWLDDPKMNSYLCPDTLFRPSKFEKYLNQPGPATSLPNGRGQSANDRHFERNRKEAMKIMEAMERAGIRAPTTLLEN